MNATGAGPPFLPPLPPGGATPPPLRHATAREMVGLDPGRCRAVVNGLGTDVCPLGPRRFRVSLVVVCPRCDEVLHIPASPHPAEHPFRYTTSFKPRRRRGGAFPSAEERKDEGEGDCRGA